VSHLGPQTRRRARSGQSLVEFALVVPILLLMIGGVIQLGVIFAAKSTLTQVARDTGRWASTQTFSPCDAAATDPTPQPLTQADATAVNSGLINYQGGMWTTTNFTPYADNAALPAAPPLPEGVEAVWSYTSGTCPTTNNAGVAYVTVRLSHEVPLFLPGLFLIPGSTCDGNGCRLTTTATAMFRMEPPPP
jgi:Flp pilus assembly protein TadG